VKRFLSNAVVVVICVIAAVATLKAYDYYLISTNPAPYPDIDADTPTMRTGVYYPYTGLHPQPNKRERGNEVMWDRTYGDTYDVRSGDAGFWIDRPLENWPPKAPGEVRILLVGGSAAQGWGARTNEDMFYKLLPQKLSRPGCKVEVINLAMSAWIIYQNFIALNKWGHALDPDAIISFSGHNEYVVPAQTRSDSYPGADQSAAIQYVTSYAYSPPWLKTLAEYFPGIVRRTPFGDLVRLLYFDKYKAQWKARYQKVPDSAPLAEVVEKISIPMYVHSLDSMARDFPGIPIFAVFQPLRGVADVYNRMITEIPKRVTSKQIHFLDLAHDWERNNLYPGSFVDPVHLSNEGHKIVADRLAAFLEPWVKDRCSAQASTPPR
jgi:hypothetical protein